MDEKVAKLCVAPECSILDAIKVLDETHERILLVVDKQRLLGVFTDSDVRKWILKTLMERRLNSREKSQFQEEQS